MFRQLACGGLVVAALFLVQTPAHSDYVRQLDQLQPKLGTVDDPPAEDDPCAQAKWLTWSLKDYQGNAIDLAGYKDKNVFVIVFSPGDADSCTLVRKAAKYCRDNTGTAAGILAFCADGDSKDEIKQYVRQEEWTKRVNAWNDTQATAKAAAEAAGEKFEPQAVPDYSKEIEDEMKTESGLTALVNHHLSFKTCKRCEAAWTWLTAHMAAPASAPRLIKYDSHGASLNEWTALSDNCSELAAN